MSMVITSYITTDIPELKPSDTVQFALLMMEDFGVENLPVVSETSLLGYVKYDELINLHPEARLNSIEFYGKPVTINHEHSILAGIKLFAETKFDVLAVQAGDRYVGIVWSKDLITALGNSTTANSDGAVLLVKCSTNDYSISELSRVVESENGRILGLWTWQPDGALNIHVLVKLNIRQIDHISSVLQDAGYTILHSVHRNHGDLLEDRYKSLLNYLDI